MAQDSAIEYLLALQVKFLHLERITDDFNHHRIYSNFNFFDF